MIARRAGRLFDTLYSTHGRLRLLWQQVILVILGR
jgi:hypothetical protein